MKIGDLVCLSSYGLARNYNASVAMHPHQVGIIIAIQGGYYPYKVKWTKTESNRWYQGSGHMRKELKYVRKCN